MRHLSVDEIERIIIAQKDDRVAEALAGMVDTKLEIVGISRAKLADILEQIKPNLPETEEEFIWLNLLQDLWESPYFESHLIALQLLFARSELIDSHLWGMLDHWTGAVDNWVLADWLGHLRAISIHKAHTLVMRMAPWLQSENPWRRRSAIVSLCYIDPKTLDQKLLLEPHEIFAFVEPVLEDRHEAVLKALTWLLRELDARFPGELETFLKRYKDKLSPELLNALHPRDGSTKPTASPGPPARRVTHA